MRRIFSLLVLLIVAYAIVPGFVLAGAGFYVSSEIGVNVASGLDTTGFSNDRATVCDEFINPDFRKVPPSVANSILFVMVASCRIRYAVTCPICDGTEANQYRAESRPTTLNFSASA